MRVGVAVGMRVLDNMCVCVWLISPHIFYGETKKSLRTFDFKGVAMKTSLLFGGLF